MPLALLGGCYLLTKYDDPTAFSKILDFKPIEINYGVLQLVHRLNETIKKIFLLFG